MKFEAIQAQLTDQENDLFRAVMRDCVGGTVDPQRAVKQLAKVRRVINRSRSAYRRFERDLDNLDAEERYFPQGHPMRRETQQPAK